MKRVIFVLALTLILTVCFMGETFALNHPYNDPWNPEGDEHPWGGDEVISDPPPIARQNNHYIMATSIPVVDVILRFFIVDHVIEISERYNRSYNSEFLNNRRFSKPSTPNKEGIRR